MNWKRYFPWRKRFKSLKIDEKFTVEEAFVFDGVTYYHFADQFQAPSGRELMAIAYYEELAMRCDKEYLEKHTRAVDKILSDTKRISVKDLAILNNNLAERLELMPLQDYIYRLGSVMFFDENESIYTYDFEYNQRKIEKWKKGADVLDFFLRTPLKDLIRSLGFAGQNLRTSFPIAEKIDKIHRDRLSEVLSGKA